MEQKEFNGSHIGNTKARELFIKFFVKLGTHDFDFITF